MVALLLPLLGEMAMQIVAHEISAQIASEAKMKSLQS